MGYSKCGQQLKRNLFSLLQAWIMIEKMSESGPTDKTDEDREQVSVEEVDHDLVTESGPDDIMDVDRDQLGISTMTVLGNMAIQLAPL